jgi:hypothetical protein
MANKKRGKKQKKVAKTSPKKTTRARKPAGNKAARKSAKKPVAKKKSSLKKAGVKAGGTVAPKKAAPKKAAPKKAASPKAPSAKTAVTQKKRPGRKQRFDEDPYETQGLVSGSTTESGDTQGLSNVESADSESVDELVEEGNAFEADVVAGVERAGDRPGKEVRTREVPEDDVPEEYLDQD